MNDQSRQTATSEQIQVLAQNLEKYRYIWNVEVSDFHNRVLKRQNWRDLARDCGLSLADTKRTYETQRKKFRQEYKIRTGDLTGYSGDPAKHKTYSHFETLSFLIPSLKIRSSPDNIDNLQLSLPAESIKDECESFPSEGSPLGGIHLTLDDPQSVSPVYQPASLESSTLVEQAESRLPAPCTEERRAPRLSARKRGYQNMSCMGPMLNRAFDINSSPNDECTAWAMTATNDLRKIRNPLKRRKLMHTISGILVDVLEQQELALPTSTPSETPL